MVYRLRCQEKQSALHMVFIDLEKALERVLRQERWHSRGERTAPRRKNKIYRHVMNVGTGL